MKMDILINKYFHKLNENDIHILSFIQENLELCKDETISEIAKLCNVSPSTVIRTAKKLNFSGYSEFRYFLKEEADRIRKAKSPNNKYFESSILLKDVTQTIRFFEENNSLIEIYKLLSEANNIFAYGTGYGQNLMLKEFSRCLLNNNIYLNIIPAKTEFEIISHKISPKDLLFIVSLSGNINKIDNIIKNIVIKQVPIISITTFSRNELANLANFNLYYQLSYLDEENTLNNSSFCTLNLVLSLLYEGFNNYINSNISNP